MNTIKRKLPSGIEVEMRELGVEQAELVASDFTEEQLLGPGRLLFANSCAACAIASVNGVAVDSAFSAKDAIRLARDWVALRGMLEELSRSGDQMRLLGDSKTDAHGNRVVELPCGKVVALRPLNEDEVEDVIGRGTYGDRDWLRLRNDLAERMIVSVDGAAVGVEFRGRLAFPSNNDWNVLRLAYQGTTEVEDPEVFFRMVGRLPTTGGSSRGCAGTGTNRSPSCSGDVRAGGSGDG